MLVHSFGIDARGLREKTRKCESEPKHKDSFLVARRLTCREPSTLAKSGPGDGLFMFPFLPPARGIDIVRRLAGMSLFVVPSFVWAAL